MSEEKDDDRGDSVDVGRVATHISMDERTYRRDTRLFAALGSLLTTVAIALIDHYNTQLTEGAGDKPQSAEVAPSYTEIRQDLNRLRSDFSASEALSSERAKGNLFFRQSAESRLDKAEGEISGLKTRTKSISGSVEHIKSQLAGEG